MCGDWCCSAVDAVFSNCCQRKQSLSLKCCLPPLSLASYALSAKVPGNLCSVAVLYVCLFCLFKDKVVMWLWLALNSWSSCHERSLTVSLSLGKSKAENEECSSDQSGLEEFSCGWTLLGKSPSNPGKIRASCSFTFYLVFSFPQSPKN